jgi:hypothetical protein
MDRWLARGARPALIMAAAALAVGACAPVLPEAPAERALVRDVARAVDLRSEIGWLVDDHELHTAVPEAMKSVCQVRPEDRQAALAWLDRRIDVEGGDVVSRWRATGKRLGRVEQLLLLSRVRLVLRTAEDWAQRGRCPFWLEPSPVFAGVHVQGRRFIFTVEGGGRFIQEFALGTTKYGGGGAGRLLVGYGLGEAWALSAGLEFGGSARFTNLRLGEQSEFPELVGLAAAPIVLRWQFGLSAQAEIEAGPLAYIDRASADQATGRIEANYDWGWRVGFAVGGTYLRLQRGVMPRFAVAVNVDRVPGVDGKAALTQLGIGLRTGVDLSRWTSF